MSCIIFGKNIGPHFFLIFFLNLIYLRYLSL